MSIGSATQALNYPERPIGGDAMTGMAMHRRNLRHAAPGTGTEPRNYPWPLLLIAAPAAVAVWSGWVGLGGMCGFGPVHLLPGIAPGFTVNTAITLPVGIESYGAYALSAWIGGNGSDRTRAFARRSAIGALVLGCLGQVVFHLLAAAHWTEAPWPVVMLVACLPVVTLSFAAALVHLKRADVRAVAETEAEAERVKAEAAVRAEARAAAKAEFPPPARNRKPAGTGSRGRKPEPGADRKQSEPEAQPVAEEVIDIDSEARILQLIAEGSIDPEGAVLQLVGEGVSASKAGVLVGKSDSYGRQVVRAAKKLAEAAPKGPDAEGSDS